MILLAPNKFLESLIKLYPMLPNPIMRTFSPYVNSEEFLIAP